MTRFRVAGRLLKFWQHTVLIFLALCFFAPWAKAQESPKFPLQVSENRRYFEDQNGSPFLVHGDTAWSLIAQLDLKDTVFYLDHRKSQGFNSILVNLIEHKFGSKAPRNYYGELPFTGRPFSTPNENYFAHADSVINEAAKRGILILLCPLYLGYACGSEGWCSEVKAATLSEMRSWGRYVGNRYKSFDNIVWCIGGDTDPSQVKDKVLECVNGIRETDSRHLFTAHNQPESYAVTPWPNQAWLNVNNVYSYSTAIYTRCKTAYDRTPVTPYFMVESAYENEHNSSQQRLRSQAYWPVLCGGIGHIFGNCPIWHFGSSSNWCGLVDWKTQMDAAGSFSMMHVKDLFASRAWHLLVPDFTHLVMKAGYGSWGAVDYSTAALTTNGNTMIAYLPSSRQVTIDMSKISGTEAECWWYNPSDGASTLIGTYATSGSRQFTPPSSGDWVLVIDDASLNLPAPGTGVSSDAYSPKSPTNLRILRN